MDAGRMMKDNILRIVCFAVLIVLLVCAEIVDDVCARRRIKARTNNRDAAAAAPRASGRRKGLQHKLRTSVRH
jgi:hypothetical protein